MALRETSFDLESFFPYKVRVFYRAVSERVASVYKDAYGLSVQEWRIMAVLGSTDGMTATDIVKRSSMDKVVISRALQRMKDRDLITQVAHPSDGRQVVLSLSDEGTRIFKDLVPKVRHVEEGILKDLSPDEINVLEELMQRVRLAAEP